VGEDVDVPALPEEFASLDIVLQADGQTVLLAV
jgi:hypothetical protein